MLKVGWNLTFKSFLKLFWIISTIFFLGNPKANAQLDCSFGNYAVYMVSSNQWVNDFTCVIERQTIENSATSIQITTNKNTKTNQDVHQVLFKRTNMDHIPDSLFETFPNLLSITLKYLTLNTIPAEFLKSGEKLKYFHCNKNILTKLDGNIFASSPNLQQISFGYNQLVQIHRHAFKGLRSLTILYLHQNDLKRLELGLFQDSVSLKELDLHTNELESFEPFLFSQCEKLEKMKIEFNKIKAITKNDFNGLKNLNELRLQNNLLTRIESETFSELKSLKTLLLSHNSIHYVAKDAFTGATNLQSLWLSHNKISQLDGKTFKGFPRLSKVYLMNNTCINKNYDYLLITLENDLMASCGQFDHEVNQATNSDLTECIIPRLPNGRVMNTLDQSVQQPGSIYTDWAVLTVECDRNFFLVFDTKEQKEVLCRANGWDKPFPSCKKLCSSSDINGLTIKTHCSSDGSMGGTVSCDSNLLPGTMAHIDCKFGYRPPDKYVNKDFVCLDSGNWDHEKFSCEPICGVLTPQSTAFIFGGRDTNILEVPWHVGIYKENLQICGGSIVSEKVVISAAHCFFPKSSTTISPASEFKVAAGKYFRAWEAVEELRSQVFDVEKILIENEYRGYSGYYEADISVLILKSLITYAPHIAPVCMEFYKYGVQKTPPNGTQAVVAGWGLTENNGQQSEFLQKIRMPIIDYYTCKAKAPEEYKNFVNGDKICAGYADGKGVCSGDSGGGLTIPQVLNGKPIYFLHGIVSNGKTAIGGCDLTFYSVFTNVQEYSNLIKNALRDYRGV